MDTGTHLVMGFGLAGLAFVDPVIAQDPRMSTAVLIGTVVGSQAPDFDSLLRLKGNAFFIRHHRGWSHSLPAVALWTILIGGTLSLFFPDLPAGHIAFWVLLAVCIHVLTDMFNAYGTQALRPFTDKWVSWNIIHLFDPVIFISHLIAIFIWSFHLKEPQHIFPVLYAFLFVYFFWRTWVHYRLEKRLPDNDKEYRPGDTYTAIPTPSLHAWNVIKKNADGGYTLGEWNLGKLKWIDKVKCTDHPAVEASKKTFEVDTFLYISEFSCPKLKEHPWGYEVRWIDVRYRHRKQYPFMAIALLDKQFRPKDSYVGWVSEAKLEKKLRFNHQ